MGCKDYQKPKVQYRKGLWSPEEDQKLRDYIFRYGHSCWSTLPAKASLQRIGKSYRLRWINYLRPGLKHGMFTQEEEETVMKLHAKLGNKWSYIARHLPGRTDNEVKNNWNSYLKKYVQSKCTPPAGSTVTYQERLNRPASSDPSQLVKSSLADNPSNEPAGTVAAPAPLRPRAPLFPEVMFVDWLDTSLMALDLDAGFFKVNGPCGTVSLHRIDDGGILWGFHGAEDQMDVQEGGFCDLLSVNDFFGPIRHRWHGLVSVLSDNSFQSGPLINMYQ